MARITIPLTDDIPDDLTVSQALKLFLDMHPEFDKCMKSKEHAGMLNTQASKKLYEFLTKCGHSPRIMVGKGYTRSLDNASIQLLKQISELGSEQAVRRQITHGVVKVNDMAIDLTHLRLGDHYEPYTFPYSKFHTFWEHVFDASNAAAMTTLEVRERMKAMRDPSLTHWNDIGDFKAVSSDDDLKKYTWFRYKGAKKITVQTKAGKTFELLPKGVFGVKAYTSTHDTWVLAEEPNKKLVVDAKCSDALMNKSGDYRGKLPEAAPAQKKNVIQRVKLTQSKLAKLPKVRIEINPETVDEDIAEERTYRRVVPILPDPHEDDFSDVLPLRKNTME